MHRSDGTVITSVPDSREAQPEISQENDLKGI